MDHEELKAVQSLPRSIGGGLSHESTKTFATLERLRARHETCLANAEAELATLLKAKREQAAAAEQRAERQAAEHTGRLSLLCKALECALDLPAVNSTKGTTSTAPPKLAEVSSALLDAHYLRVAIVAAFDEELGSSRRQLAVDMQELLGRLAVAVSSAGFLIGEPAVAAVTAFAAFATDAAKQNSSTMPSAARLRDATDALHAQETASLLTLLQRYEKEARSHALKSFCDSHRAFDAVLSPAAAKLLTKTTSSLAARHDSVRLPVLEQLLGVSVAAVARAASSPEGTHSAGLVSPLVHEQLLLQLGSLRTSDEADISGCVEQLQAAQQAEAASSLSQLQVVTGKLWRIKADVAAASAVLTNTFSTVGGSLKAAGESLQQQISSGGSHLGLPDTVTLKATRLHSNPLKRELQDVAVAAVQLGGFRQAPIRERVDALRTLLGHADVLLAYAAASGAAGGEPAPAPAVVDSADHGGPATDPPNATSDGSINSISNSDTPTLLNALHKLLSSAAQNPNPVQCAEDTLTTSAAAHQALVRLLAESTGSHDAATTPHGSDLPLRVRSELQACAEKLGSAILSLYQRQAAATAPRPARTATGGLYAASGSGAKLVLPPAFVAYCADLLGGVQPASNSADSGANGDDAPLGAVPAATSPNPPAPLPEAALTGVTSQGGEGADTSMSGESCGGGETEDVTATRRASSSPLPRPARRRSSIVLEMTHTTASAVARALPLPLLSELYQTAAISLTAPMLPPAALKALADIRSSCTLQLQAIDAVDAEVRAASEPVLRSLSAAQASFRERVSSALHAAVASASQTCERVASYSRSVIASSSQAAEARARSRAALQSSLASEVAGLKDLMTAASPAWDSHWEAAQQAGTEKGADAHCNALLELLKTLGQRQHDVREGAGQLLVEYEGAAARTEEALATALTQVLGGHSAALTADIPPSTTSMATPASGPAAGGKASTAGDPAAAVDGNAPSSSHPLPLQLSKLTDALMHCFPGTGLAPQEAQLRIAAAVSRRLASGSSNHQRGSDHDLAATKAEAAGGTAALSPRSSSALAPRLLAAFLLAPELTVSQVGAVLGEERQAPPPPVAVLTGAGAVTGENAAPALTPTAVKVSERSPSARAAATDGTATPAAPAPLGKGSAGVPQIKPLSAKPKETLKAEELRAAEARAAASEAEAAARAKAAEAEAEAAAAKARSDAEGAGLFLRGIVSETDGQPLTPTGDTFVPNLDFRLDAIAAAIKRMHSLWLPHARGVVEAARLDTAAYCSQVAHAEASRATVLASHLTAMAGRVETSLREPRVGVLRANGLRLQRHSARMAQRQTEAVQLFRCRLASSAVTVQSSITAAEDGAIKSLTEASAAADPPPMRELQQLVEGGRGALATGKQSIAASGKQLREFLAQHEGVLTRAGVDYLCSCHGLALVAAPALLPLHLCATALSMSSHGSNGAVSLTFGASTSMPLVNTHGTRAAAGSHGAQQAATAGLAVVMTARGYSTAERKQTEDVVAAFTASVCATVQGAVSELSAATAEHERDLNSASSKLEAAFAESTAAFARLNGLGPKHSAPRRQCSKQVAGLLDAARAQSENINARLEECEELLRDGVPGRAPPAMKAELMMKATGSGADPQSNELLIQQQSTGIHEAVEPIASGSFDPVPGGGAARPSLTSSTTTRAAAATATTTTAPKGAAAARSSSGAKTPGVASAKVTTAAAVTELVPTNIPALPPYVIVTTQPPAAVSSAGISAPLSIRLRRSVYVLRDAIIGLAADLGVLQMGEAAAPPQQRHFLLPFLTLSDGPGVPDAAGVGVGPTPESAAAAALAAAQPGEVTPPLEYAGVEDPQAQYIAWVTGPRAAACSTSQQGDGGGDVPEPPLTVRVHTLKGRTPSALACHLRIGSAVVPLSATAAVPTASTKAAKGDSAKGGAAAAAPPTAKPPAVNAAPSSKAVAGPSGGAKPSATGQGQDSITEVQGAVQFCPLMARVDAALLQCGEAAVALLASEASAQAPPPPVAAAAQPAVDPKARATTAKATGATGKKGTAVPAAIVEQPVAAAGPPPQLKAYLEQERLHALSTKDALTTALVCQVGRLQQLLVPCGLKLVADVEARNAADIVAAVTRNTKALQASVEACRGQQQAFMERARLRLLLSPEAALQLQRLEEEEAAWRASALQGVDELVATANITLSRLAWYCLGRVRHNATYLAQAAGECLMGSDLGQGGGGSEPKPVSAEATEGAEPAAPALVRGACSSCCFPLVPAPSGAATDATSTPSGGCCTTCAATEGACRRLNDLMVREQGKAQEAAEQAQAEFGGGGAWEKAWRSRMASLRQVNGT